MEIKSIYFTDSHIIGIDESGKEWPQSLLWYPGLMGADNKQRDNYEIGLDGFHWRNVDEDISFESFFYDDAEPSPLQHFFLAHKELKISEFAKAIGIDASLLRNYINGFKKPSKEREQAILKGIHALASQYASTNF